VYLCFSSKKKKKKKNDNNKAQSEKNFKSKDFSREKILKRKEFFLCLSLTSTLFFSPYIYLYHRQHTHTHTHTHTMRVTIYTRVMRCVSSFYVRVKFVPIFVSSFQLNLPFQKMNCPYLGFCFFFVSFCLFLTARRLPQTRARAANKERKSTRTRRDTHTRK
jgi:Flp pilus assembly protein TadG